MSKDISTQYTKDQNNKCGRNGYCGAHKEKLTIITPSQYGMFLSKMKRKK